MWHDNKQENAFMEAYEIKKVNIVHGSLVYPGWISRIQVVTTDKGEFMDSLPINNGHDWQRERGKIVMAEEVSTGASRNRINFQKSYVTIGGVQLALNPKKGVTPKHWVWSVVPCLLKYKLIPDDEMHRLLTDEKYCYDTFGLDGHNTLLKKDKEEFYDHDNKCYICFDDKYSEYYICSQWGEKNKHKFAQWLINFSLTGQC